MAKYYYYAVSWSAAFAYDAYTLVLGSVSLGASTFAPAGETLLYAALGLLIDLKSAGSLSASDSGSIMNGYRSRSMGYGTERSTTSSAAESRSIGFQ